MMLLFFWIIVFGDDTTLNSNFDQTSDMLQELDAAVNWNLAKGAKYSVARIGYCLRC